MMYISFLMNITYDNHGFLFIIQYVLTCFCINLLFTCSLKKMPLYCVTYSKIILWLFYTTILRYNSLKKREYVSSTEGQHSVEKSRQSVKCPRIQLESDINLWIVKQLMLETVCIIIGVRVWRHTRLCKRIASFLDLLIHVQYTTRYGWWYGHILHYTVGIVFSMNRALVCVMYPAPCFALCFGNDGQLIFKLIIKRILHWTFKNIKGNYMIGNGLGVNKLLDELLDVYTLIWS